MLVFAETLNVNWIDTTQYLRVTRWGISPSGNNIEDGSVGIATYFDEETFGYPCY